MNILFASHSAFDENFVVGSHQLARAFVSLGHKVFHISSPVTGAHIASVRDSRTRSRFASSIRGPRQLRPGLWDWVPFSPVPWQVARRIQISGRNLFLPNERSLRRGLRVAGIDRVDLLLIDEPRLVGIEKLFGEAYTGYRATDLYAQMKQDAAIIEAERLLCERVDLLVATSAPVAEHLQSLSGNRLVHTVANGVELPHFSHDVEPHPSIGKGARPRLVYVGALDGRFDWTTVAMLGTGLPACDILIYGPETGNRPESLPRNVHVKGPLRYQDLPSVLRHCSVGLLPMNDHPANQGRSPMKLYEYAASGLPVVARATPELRRRDESFVSLYTSGESAIACCAAALEGGRLVTPDLEKHGWRNRAEYLLRLANNESVTSQEVTHSPTASYAEGHS